MVGDELTGAADIATGVLVARAVEKEASEPTTKDGHFAEGACLNCGTELTGHYCHECGQQGHLHRTLSAFWHDLAHGVLHFEGKIWKTLPMLAFRPGELTRRYVHGERAKFVSPLALFLFSVFLMFAIFSVMDAGIPTPNVPAGAGAEVAKGVDEGKADLTKQLAAIDAKIAEAEAKGADTGKLKRERANVQGLLRMLGGGPTVLGGMTDDGKPLKINTGWPRLDKGIEKANNNPGLLLYKLQANAYKFSWMLIPISVPFVWLLFFWRRQFRVYDHAIFVTYSLSFLMLLIGLTTLLSGLGVIAGVTALILMLVPPIHLYKQLKHAYGLSRTGALLRTFFLLVSGTIVLVLFILMLLGLGLTG